MSTTVPAHLRCHLVEQDYGQYTEADHAVWRFVLLETYARLKDTAHPAYASGLAATGISVERIPRIEEMNEKLARFGWSAVCVDGFIPPRAFQAFQANAILPIAADIRTSKHLAYTPAPDIVHEAAGHAPILSDPDYARFLRRIGSVSERTFSSPIDRQIYRAIHALSEIKENPNETERRVAEAEAALEQALAAQETPSESARLARLYWWTAEYGLVGTPSDYRLYGAGLLSSLGESDSCHDPEVRKIPLTEECLEVGYDITRTQPQLFVARDFAQLDEVLTRVERTLAHRIGGRVAIEAAHASQELATVTLEGGVEVIGEVVAFETRDDCVEVVALGGEPALRVDAVLRTDLPRPSVTVIPVGTLRDGTPLSRITANDLQRFQGDDGTLALTLSRGHRILGTLDHTVEIDGRCAVLVFRRLEIVAPDGRSFLSQTPHALPLATAIETAQAGAPSAYFPPTVPRPTRVPKPRWYRPSERALVGLFERSIDAHRRRQGSALEGEFAKVEEELARDHPDEWLLRWNLLESLVKSGSTSALVATLERELVALERSIGRAQPIGRGLSYIRALRARREAG